MEGKKIVVFCFFSAAIFFSSCKKDPPIPIEPDCTNFLIQNGKPLSGLIFSNWLGIDTTYNTPTFNPKNPDEIIYVRGKISVASSWIIKRNLLTGLEEKIIEGVLRHPDWSSNDWILFNHADNQVWKIKSNGDSLTLLTIDMQGGQDAVWNPEGSKMAFFRKVGSVYYVIIADAKGNYLDTIQHFSYYLTNWSKNGKYLSGVDGANPMYCDVASKNQFRATSNSIDENVTNLIYIDGVTWTPDSQFLIWCNHYGIFKTDINSKTTTRIKTSCDSKYYVSLSVSPDGKKIIAGRQEQKLDGKNLYIKSGLSLINIDGTNEIKIGNP